MNNISDTNNVIVDNVDEIKMGSRVASKALSVKEGTPARRTSDHDVTTEMSERKAHEMLSSDVPQLVEAAHAEVATEGASKTSSKKRKLSEFEAGCQVIEDGQVSPTQSAKRLRMNDGEANSSHAKSLSSPHASKSQKDLESKYFKGSE